MGEIRIPVDNGDIIARIEEMEIRIMGAVSEALVTINATLHKVGAEYDSKLAELQAQLERKYNLDDEDIAAIAELSNLAQSLDSKVADSITEPLPDPVVESGTLDPSAPDVIDPENPLPEGGLDTTPPAY